LPALHLSQMGRRKAGMASYAMLMFTARLQRQDATLEETALNLGASRVKVVHRFARPFQKPTIETAAVITFLQSFENDTTTTFSIGGDHALVAEIGARMRFGISPMINTIGILFIIVTVVCAVVWAMIRCREHLEETAT